jgi:hypothetical protein
MVRIATNFMLKYEGEVDESRNVGLVKSWFYRLISFETFRL